MYNAYVIKIEPKQVREHPNADRLVIVDLFGTSVVVGKDIDLNTLQIYFPCDGQLDETYARKNKLLREKDENGNDIGYMDVKKRNVKAIRLRGEQSDGILLPLASLSSFGDVNALNAGDVISTFNGHEICRKYVPAPKVHVGVSTPFLKKAKVNHFPQFFEHKDTEQLAYNLGQFKSGDECVITLKIHGTSARTGNLIEVKEKKRTFWQRLLRKPASLNREYKSISGTRRVVLEDMSANPGFYGTNDFRAKWHEFFEGKLMKGEVVYYEIVGATGPNALIMPSCDNAKLKDKAFVKQYGPTTIFSYSCDIEKGENDIYVYRMTMVNEDGYVVEYPWDLVKVRCEQMGVKHVLELWRGTLPKTEVRESAFCPISFFDHEEEVNAGDYIMQIAEEYHDGPDLIDPRHVREGCVVRINNAPTFKAFKSKGFSFKVLEGLIKEVAEEPDMEEMEDMRGE